MQNLELLNQREKHGSLSDKYKMLTTQETLKDFTDKGFFIDKVNKGKHYKEKSGEYAAHIVRLRHNDLKIGNDYIEVVISNSYDGTIPFSINLGIFRLVCSNGMVVGDSVYSASIKHIGQDFYKQVNLYLNEALTKIDVLKLQVEKLKNTELTVNQVKDLANKVFLERLKSVKNLKLIDLENSLVRERLDDLGNDAWTILNVVQEKILRGGIHYVYDREIKDENDKSKVIELKTSHKVTKSIFQPKETLRLNKLVWEYAVQQCA